VIGTANGRAILRAAIHVPRVGVWHADVEVEGEEDDAITGSVDLEFEGITWSGTVRRGGVDNGRIVLLVVGGAGGLERELDPKYYVDATSALPLDDIIRECGESLSSSSAAEARSMQLARWTRRRERGGVSLADLASALGLDWRVLPDGEVWVGTEAWSAATLEHDVIHVDPARDYRLLGVDAPTLVPGTTLDGRRVGYVLHTIDPRSVRSEVWLDPSEGRLSDRPKRWLERFLDRVLRRVDRTALYPARVVQQSADGTLEVQIDDQRWSSLTKVPIRPFVPGATIKVAGGARVLIGWEEADPRKPYAALWESGTLTDLTVAAQTLIKFGENATDFVALASLVKQRIDDIQSKFDAHTHPAGSLLDSTSNPVTGTTAPTLDQLGPQDGVAATKVKAE
jgi:hypothetical protein